MVTGGGGRRWLRTLVAWLRLAVEGSEGRDEVDIRGVGAQSWRIWEAL